MKLLIVLCLTVACVYAREQSKCEKHRERELNRFAVGKLVPECEENGDYKGKQCRGGTQYCECWDKKGNQITAPSKILKACECPREKHEGDKLTAEHMVGVFSPRCKIDGTYDRKQCHPSTGYCWCADEDGKAVSELTRDEINC